MGGKKSNIVLPEPPKPKRSFFNIFLKTPTNDEIRTISRPPSSKRKGFVMPRNQEQENMHIRQFEQVANLRRRLDHDTRERQNNLSEKEEGLLKREEEITRVEKKVKSDKALIVRLRNEVNEKIKNTEDKDISLKERSKFIKLQESEANKELKSLQKKLNAFHKEINILSSKREKLENDIGIRKEQLNVLGQTFDGKQKTLNDNEKLLAMRENEVLLLVKKLEEDKDLLDKKEEEIINKIDIVEKEKNLLGSKEDEIIKKIQELEKKKEEPHIERMKMKKQIEIEKQSLQKKDIRVTANIATKISRLKEKEYLSLEKIKKSEEKLKKMQKEKDSSLKLKERVLNSREMDLKKRELKVKNAKELKENIKRMEKINKDLIKKYTSFKKDYLHSLNIIQKENELEKTRQNLITREKILRGIEQKLRERKHDIDDLEYRNYFSHNTETSNLHNKAKGLIVGERVTKHGDLFSLIDETRDLLEKGMIDDAKYNLKKIHQLFISLELKKDKKDAVYYDILEIQNAIEIAEL